MYAYKKKKEKEKEKSKKEKNRFDLSHMRYASIRDPLKHQPRLNRGKVGRIGVCSLVVNSLMIGVRGAQIQPRVKSYGGVTDNIACGLKTVKAWIVVIVLLYRSEVCATKRYDRGNRT